jgi:hypothetical protein
VRALIVCAGVCLASLASTQLAGQNARPAQGEATARLDPARELVMKIDAPFTVAAVATSSARWRRSCRSKSRGCKAC